MPVEISTLALGSSAIVRRFTLCEGLISPLSIEFIMELRLQYVCILTYCDIFASGLLFTETTKKVSIKLI